MLPEVYYLCAPSGAGKNAFLSALASFPRAPYIVVRTITRPDDPTEASEMVSEMEFMRLKKQGRFVLDWSAHGYLYGIRATEFSKGDRVILNGSRVYWPTAKTIFPNLRLITLEVPDSVLKARLEQRGRESEFEIYTRLKRNRQLATALQNEKPFCTLINDGTPEDMAIAFMDRIGC